MRHVLIVDDELDLGRLWQATITLLDPSMPVVVVPTAEEAVDQISENNIDLLITDVRLPGMSGFDLVTKIRETNKDMKIIMITGLPDDEFPIRARALGVNDFFRKPMSIPALTTAVKKLLTIGENDAQVDVGKGQATQSGINDQSLSEFLEDMRKKLDASVILILDENNEVMTQAGYIPYENFEKDWKLPIMNSLRTSRQVVSLTDTAKPVSVQIFKGLKFDLVIAPIGKLGLVVYLEGGDSRLNLVIALEEILVEFEKLYSKLDEAGIDYQPGEQLETVFSEEDANFAESNTSDDSGGLDDLFALLDDKPDLAVDEIEQFWDQSGSSNTQVADSPETYSYTQAREMGIILEEDE